MGPVLCGCSYSDSSPSGGDSGSGSFHREPQTQPLRRRRGGEEPTGEDLTSAHISLVRTRHTPLLDAEGLKMKVGCEPRKSIYV